MSAGDLIAAARKRKGLSLRALSKITGIQNSHLSELETGKRPNPTWQTMMKVAKALNLRLDKLAKEDSK